MAQLHDLTALEQAAAIRRGELTSVELTEHYLSRTERLDLVVGAFITTTAELAVAQARRADAAVRAGADIGPLHGTVVPVKDLHEVAGVPTSYGSRVLGSVAQADEESVARMRAAGLVFTGKTNTPELGLPSYTCNELVGPARCPWELDRSAGGSSGGAAAAVAAGLASAAHGSDGGGSLRIPASACGLVGFKPSRGLVSNAPRVDRPGELVVQGPVARTVADAAALLDVLAGTGVQHQQAAARQPPPLRIGLLLQPVLADVVVDEECRSAAQDAAAMLATLGHRVGEVDRPFGPEVLPQFQTIWSALAASIDVPAQLEPQLAPLTRWLRAEGRGVSVAALRAAVEAVRMLAAATTERWAELDAVVTPTVAEPPPLLRDLPYDADPAADFAAQTRFTPWTSLANMTGAPAVSLPLSRSRSGLPIGVQLIGRQGADAALIAVAAQVAAAVGPDGRRPGMW
ncbi:MAG: amidase [Actinomycetota bacterium]|nr:MAG: amidase [Actinomycetota bacterium]